MPNITNWKNYTKSSDVFGFRVFDISIFDSKTIEQLRTFKREQFSGWRERNNQSFVDLNTMVGICNANKLQYVHPFGQVDIPTSIEETHMWLASVIPETHAALNREFDSTDSFARSNRMPEGLVVRTANRKYIAKIRFEDYQKYARKKKETK